MSLHLLWKSRCGGAKLQLEDVALAARQCWEKALSTVSVEIAPLSRRRVFYTGLPHTKDWHVKHLMLSGGFAQFRVEAVVEQDLSGGR